MYLEHAFSFLPALASFDVLLMILLGVVVGLVIGGMPGLNPPTVIALMIPMTFQMAAAPALILMVSCYAAGIYGGSFTAILFRAPGEASSAASAIEGFEMTRRGKAIEALRIMTFASVVGGVLSGFVLLLLAPPLSRVALLFGPSEYFLMALLGLMAVAAVSFGALSKGLISGLFGLFLATIGIDLYSGFPRFTFGATGLMSGINILPAIIGLFAFAQGLNMCAGEGQKTISGVKRLSWNIWPKWSEIKALRGPYTRGWIVGLIIGIIPATGSSVAQWISYAWEIRRGGPRDQFGRGEPKGLAGAEGANNSATGTSLIPMFVLGIPGGISAAVILGALIMHGLQPGMRLFTTDAEVFYTVAWGFILANLVMGILALPFCRVLAYLTVVPNALLAPVILIFCVVGTYTNFNTMFNVWLMMGFGVLGFFMDKHGFSPAALLLGLILGPIAESGLRDMMVVSHGNPVAFMLQRPVSLTLIAIILLMLFFSRRQTPWEDTKEEIEAVSGDAPGTDGPSAPDTDPPASTTGRSSADR